MNEAYRKQLAATPKKHQREKFRIDMKRRTSLQTNEMARPTGFEPVTSASGVNDPKM